MPNYGLHYIGSFQTGTRFTSENPLEEVWSCIALLGSPEHIRSRVSFEESIEDPEVFIDYAVVRIRQATELRAASGESSLLTSPLTLYYSFLNLTRALLAINSEIMPAKLHGLTFESRKNLLNCRAKVTKGTFTDYLEAEGTTWQSGLKVSLADALARVIEISDDCRLVEKMDSLAIPVGRLAL
jgi:hypothetical protein